MCVKCDTSQNPHILRTKPAHFTHTKKILMTKLEILAAYLPHKVKVKYKKQKYRLVGISYHDTSIVVSLTPLFEKNMVISIINPDDLLLCLNSMDEAQELIALQFRAREHGLTYDHDAVELFSFEKTGFDNFSSTGCIATELPYESVQWLLKRHYDVFSLLPVNDAYDLAND